MSIALNVITGFLGSGKTTLLKRLLADENMGDTALLINEFGDVGIDHLLVEEVAPDTVLLPSGCVCCTVRGELKDALLGLLERRNRGEIPAFRRVILETTGLADPAPILTTLSNDPQLRGRFHIGLIVTLVDACHATLQERLHPEWLAQVAAADRLLLSKTDLVDEPVLDGLREHLQALNFSAPLLDTADVHSGDQLLLGEGMRSDEPAAEVTRWQLHRVLSTSARHGDAQVCCLTFERPLDWVGFGVWLSMLLRCHGERILRVKGLLNVNDNQAPIVIHGVQHCLHAPVHLAAWPGEDRTSRLVFILRGLDPDLLRRSFEVFSSSFAPPLNESAA
ncbi:CobW family GTP-binding protein [Pseudomonas syringae]|uniref:GTP-binding protein n=1 Tax=Pseudomonas syringae pv. syringae TaxID=321 RepID=A0AAE5S571_PSESY|nr:GTP-binding protein [Pseudomonas syringae]EKG36474.1 cobalamin synthesis protein/P47K family protein [Pseudomonas syringae pv. avellanae str. ISPaVe037]MCF5651052.1 GTP-binding protein [Pseudomonas syringae]MCF5735714.1 GTP-binding protein [Pseudomonas syringae]MCF5742534.1 GTP-binding protein [Pseudomonas syringae]MCF5750780.1 GTP-binding protein [Pseudomonas syringae]